MVTPSPWSVKGVDPEAREAAKIAARRAGLTVGQWLNQTIRAAAAEQLTGQGPAAPRHTPPPRPEQPPAPGYAPPGYAAPPPPPYPPQPGYGQYGAPPGANPPAPTLEAIFDSIQKLNKRLEETEKSAQSAVEPLAQKVDELSAKVDDASTKPNVTTAPLERAVMRLSERVEKMEGDDKDMDDRKGWRLFGSRR